MFSFTNNNVLQQLTVELEKLRHEVVNCHVLNSNNHSTNDHDVAHAVSHGHDNHHDLHNHHHSLSLSSHTIPLYHLIVDCFNILGVSVMVFCTLSILPTLLFDIIPKSLRLDSANSKTHGKILECRMQLSRGLILGMDLMVASDVIETLCGQVDLVRLIVIVAVRSWLGWERNKEMSHMTHEYDSWKKTMTSGIAMHMGKLTKENVAEKIKQTFDTFDRDHDGVIDRDELKTALSMVGVKATDHDVAEMVGHTSGGEGIRFPEFTKLVRSMSNVKGIVDDQELDKIMENAEKETHDVHSHSHH